MHLKFRALLAAALASLAFGAGAAAPAGEGYRFSPVNQYGINLTAAYWNPIIAYVSEKSGVKLTLRIGRTSADTTAYVLAQEVEFVFSNHLFSPEREKLGWRVFGRRQVPPLRGQLAVLEDSPITSINQLAGKDVAFAGPEAFIIYKVPYAHLLSKGVDVKVVFGGNQDGALAQLVAGKVSAVGGNSQLLDGWQKREGRKLRILWSSEPFHELALMAAAKVPEKDVKAVADAFLGMHKDPRGREVLEQAGAAVKLGPEAHFIASDGSEYAAYRRFFQTAPAHLR